MSNEITSYKAIVRAVIKKITGNYNEDLEQEAYLKIWQNQNNYQDEGKKSSWLGVVTANLCRDYLKSRFNKYNNCILQGEIIEKVSVTPKYEEKSYKEIADKLKIAEGTVKSRLFNARKILAKQLSFLKGEKQ